MLCSATMTASIPGSWQVSRVSKHQQQGVDIQVRLLGGEHGRLATAVRVAAEEEPRAWAGFGTKELQGLLKAFAIRRGFGGTRGA